MRRNPTPDTAAVIIVNTNGQVLVLMRGATVAWKPGYWNLPGGIIGRGEYPRQAAVREAQEETGLTPVEPWSLETYEGSGWTLEVFVAMRHRGELKLDSGSDGYAWISREQLDHFRFVPFVKRALQRAFGVLG